jgi:hypothetical protein
MKVIVKKDWLIFKTGKILNFRKQGFNYHLLCFPENSFKIEIQLTKDFLIQELSEWFEIIEIEKD